MDKKRVPHIIGRNHRNTTLSHLFTVDTEAYKTLINSTTEEQTLRLGVCQYWTPQRQRSPEHVEYLEFTTGARFWEWVIAKLPRRSCGTIIAHNASYDARQVGMFHELPALGWELSSLVLDAPPFIVEYRERCQECDDYRARHELTGHGRVPAANCTSPHRTLRFWDTMNIAPVALSELSVTVGGEKLPLPGPTATDAEWLARCHRDVDLLSTWYRGYVAWLRSHDMGNLCPTVAGQAWHAYLHRFNPAPIYVHCNDAVNRHERAGYFGGRVECFRLGELSGPRWHQVDVNSMYPAMMAETRVPTKLLTTATHPSPEKMARWLARYCVVARVELDTSVPAFPCRVADRTLYPVGQFVTTLCTPELALAYKMHAVKKVLFVSVYEGAHIFREYVETLYALRLEAKRNGDAIGEYIAKLLLNALYGKFGQVSNKWVAVGKCAANITKVEKEWSASKGEHVTTRYAGGIIERRVRGGEHSESFPAVAAHITSAGRVALWDYIQQAGPSEVAYTDTDSLVVTNVGLHRLRAHIDPGELGKLKLEATSSTLHIYGAKQYTLGGKVKSKGIRSDAERLPDGRYRQWHWRSIRWGVAHNVLDRVVLERVDKRLVGAYTKGTVDELGHVHPFTLTLSLAGPGQTAIPALPSP